MKSLYNEIGGEPVIRQITKIFYQKMDTLTEAKPIRDMHKDLNVSEEKLFMFLSGWLGGPQLYTEKYGHPMLRARHLPFKIGKDERDQWMLCMVHAVDEAKIPDPVRSEYLHALLRLADHMRNQSEV